MVFFRMRKAALFYLFVSAIFSLQAAEQKGSARPIVRQITAKAVSSSHIQVEWRLQKDFSAASLLVYRDTQPIATKAQISGAKALAELSPSSSYYIDTVRNYKAYYYAVIARTADGRLYDIVLPSINATVNAARAERPEQADVEDSELSEEKLYADGQKREVPLPYLNMLESQDKKPNKLKPEVMAAGKELAAGYEKPRHEPLAPHIFDEDMISPAGGDDYYLFEILKDYFIRRDYASSVKALQTFLGVNRSPETTKRGAFYLGEALYYCGRYRDALMMFLYVEEDEPALAKKWIQSSLDFYQIDTASL